MGTARYREGPYYGAIHIRLHICAARSPSRNHRSPFFSSDRLEQNTNTFAPHPLFSCRTCPKTRASFAACSSCVWLAIAPGAEIVLVAFVNDVGAPHQQSVHRADALGFLPVIVKAENGGHSAWHSTARAFCHRILSPSRESRRVGVEEHRLFGAGVLLPFVERRHIDWRELPLLERMEFSKHARKMRRCSSRLTENQNLIRWMPLRTRWRSNSGA